MGECFFWYRPTRVVPDQRPLNGRCCCCCYLLNLWCQTGRQLGSFYSANSKEGLLYRGAITLRLCCVLHHSSNLTVVHWSLAWRASIDSMFLWIRTTSHVRSTDSTCSCCIRHKFNKVFPPHVYYAVTLLSLSDSALLSCCYFSQATAY